MKPTPSPYPDLPSDSRPLLRAVGVLLKGPLGVVLALLVGVGALALADRESTDPYADLAVPQSTATPPFSDDQPRASAPASPRADLWVDSDVVGALVVVDGDTTGVTPVWVRGVNPGLVRVEVSARGVARDTTIYVADGDDLDVALRLGLVMRLAPGGRTSPPASLSAAPPDAPLARALADDAQPDEPSPPLARAPAAPPLVQSTPEPEPVPPNQGEISVTAPDGTAIYVNGQFRTRADGGPMAIFLPPGNHRVRAIFPSLVLEETTVYVGRTIVVSLSFGPDPGRN